MRKATPKTMWILFGGAMLLLLGLYWADVQAVVYANLSNVSLARRVAQAPNASSEIACRDAVVCPECAEVQLPSAGPSSATARVWRSAGHRAWFSGDCAGADQAWQRALDGVPNQVVLEYRRGLVAWTRGEVDQAVAAFRRVGALNRFLFLAKRAADQADWQAEVDWLAMAWHTDPTLEQVPQTPAAFAKNDQTDQAIAVWQAWAAKLPTDAAAHWRAQGEVASLREAWDEAATLFGKSIALDEDNAPLMVRTSEALRRAGQEDAAILMARQAVEVAPRYVAAYVQLTNLYLRPATLDLDQAQDWATKANELAPRNWRPLFLLGTIACRKGERERGQQLFNRAADLAPNNAQITQAQARCR